MAGLMAATQPVPTQHGYSVTLDPTWNIWGPAGGYLAAIVLRALREQAAPGHRPVSLTGQFVGIAKPGDVDVTVTPIKAGKTALYAVTLAQNGQPVFMTQIWTTARNDPSTEITPVMPDVPPPDTCESILDNFARQGVTPIPFWRNLDGAVINPRWVDDPLPENPRHQRWMRLTEWAATDSADPFLDAMRSALLIDIGVWPAHFRRLAQDPKYQAPSLDLTVWFHGGAPGSDWLLSDADSDIAGNGTLSGTVRIWSEDGRALATGGGHCLVLGAR